jgi:hypothetical protein
MPQNGDNKQRVFVITRFVSNGRRRDVCNYCGRRTNPTFFYNIYENYDAVNDYPLHTLNCAESIIKERYSIDTPYVIQYESRDNSEETTE